MHVNHSIIAASCTYMYFLGALRQVLRGEERTLPQAGHTVNHVTIGNRPLRLWLPLPRCPSQELQVLYAKHTL